jgi:hypothetical protein
MTKNHPQEWSPASRVTFRFLFCYLVLFFFPFPQGLVNPYWLGGWFEPVWRRIVPWAAGFLGIQLTGAGGGGSGDTAYDYVRVLVMVAISILATVIWSVPDRGRRDYRVLHAWSRIWLRYSLALCMLTFGAVKVVMLQFEPPGYGRLMQPLGEFSPMALLWVFMGAAPWYTTFTGVIEVIGGLLLLFRATTTLGALVVCASMANVVALDMSFDVPVKLGALHMLLAGAALLLPDAPRLWRFLVLNRPTATADLGPNFRGRALLVARCIKALVIVTGIAYLTLDARAAHERQVAAREKDPVAPEGWYQVVSVKRDGEDVPKASVEELRWKTISYRRGVLSFRGLDNRMHRFRAEGEVGRGPLTLFALGEKSEVIPDSPPIGVLTLNLPDDGAVSLSGVFYGHHIDVALSRQNPRDFPLMSRGFRWVIEEPYFH